MSIANELTRLQNAKNAISNAIKNKGVTVPATTKLDGMAALINSIPSGTSVEKYTGTIRSNGECVTAYYTDGNTLQGNSNDAWADMGLPSDSITIVKDTYVLFMGSPSTTLACTNATSMMFAYHDITSSYWHLLKITGNNFTITGG